MQHHNNPLFSFVIPFYNCGDYLQRAVSSVVTQIGNECEIILVDDGSTDDSRPLSRIISTYPHIKLISKDNAGPGAARNTGAAAAHGKYLWFLDCDDELLPDAAPQMRRFVSRHPDPAMIVGAHTTKTVAGKDVFHAAPKLSGNTSADFSAFVHRRLGSFSHGAVVVKKEVFSRFQYPESIRNNEDLVLHAQIVANYPCVSFDKPLVRIHLRPDSLRHRVEDLNLPQKVADCLFAPGKLPGFCYSHKRRFTAERELSLFRSLYKQREYQKARQVYLRAISTSPQALFRWSYLRKFLRVIWKKK